MSTVFYASYISLWLLVSFEAVLILLIYRHFGMQALGTLEGVQRDGLEIGGIAPEVNGITATGGQMKWESPADRPTLLIFAAPGCKPCAEIMPCVNHLGNSSAGRLPLSVVAVVPGTADDAAQLVGKTTDASILCLAEDGQGAFEDYKVRVTPFAFVVGEDRRILAKGLCSNPLKLRSLLLAGGLNEAATAVDQASNVRVASLSISGREMEASVWQR